MLAKLSFIYHKKLNSLRAQFCFFVSFFREFLVRQIGFSGNSRMSLNPFLMCVGQVVEMLVNASQSRLETSSSSDNIKEIKPQINKELKIELQSSPSRPQPR